MNQGVVVLELDDLDRRLIAALEEDAGQTNQALAEKVYASAPTCLRRVRRLKEAGVIRQVVAKVDRRAIGPSLTAIVEVSLDRQDSDALVAFEVAMAREACVRQCYRVSPGPDFVLVLEVADMPTYHDTSHRLFAADANVRNVRAFFSIHCSKS